MIPSKELHYTEGEKSANKKFLVNRFKDFLKTHIIETYLDILNL